MAQLILFNLYFTLSWDSFPCTLKKSKTNTKPFIVSVCFTQQLVHTQPSALDYLGYCVHTYILLPLGKKVPAAGPCAPHPPASPALSPQNLGVSLCGERSSDHWNPSLGFTDARGSKILLGYILGVSWGEWRRLSHSSGLITSLKCSQSFSDSHSPAEVQAP